MTPGTASTTHELVRVRVDELRPADVLAGSSRTIVTTPGRDAQTPRRHVQIVIRTAVGEQRVVRWRSNTRVYVRRPIELPAPRADIDG